jgi:hypothetical protein
MTTQVSASQPQATDDTTIAGAAEAIWVAVQGTLWSTLAVVPAGPDLPVAEIASALAAVGSAQRGDDHLIRALDLRGRPLAGSQELVDELAAPAPGPRLVVAVDFPLESQAALMFARSASATILVVALERTRSEDAAKIVELVGESRFLGAVVQPSAE